MDARQRQESDDDYNNTPRSRASTSSRSSAASAAAWRRAGAHGAGPAAGSSALAGTAGDELAWWGRCADAMGAYAKALVLGQRFLPEALPRLLSLFFDFCGAEGSVKGQPGAKQESTRVSGGAWWAREGG